MRFLILNTDYPEFLAWLYARNPGLEQKAYDEQMHVRMESLFGVADFYSRNLRKLGHEAWDIHINNDFMQRRWAKEHGLRNEGTPSNGPARTILKSAAHVAADTPLRQLKPLLKSMFRSLNGGAAYSYEILAAQIQHYKPDVVLNQAMDGHIGRILKEMKPRIKLLIGQIASPLPKGDDFPCYDLIISSLPNFVEYFRRMGIPAELHLFGFEPDILSKIGQQEKSIAVSFVGSVSVEHDSRIRWLEHLCRTMDIEIWGYGVGALPRDSWIRRRFKGNAWGLEMYQILHQSKITLNHHIGVAGCYANNMRLFEAAGAGSLLITDWKTNLDEIVRIGCEVLAYRTSDECVEMIEYYLKHEAERELIARAGQAKVLRQHTYAQRMKELIEIVRGFL